MEVALEILKQIGIFVFCILALYCAGFALMAGALDAFATRGEIATTITHKEVK
jgi:hypothetical protein